MHTKKRAELMSTMCHYNKVSDAGVLVFGRFFKECIAQAQPLQHGAWRKSSDCSGFSHRMLWSLTVCKQIVPGTFAFQVPRRPTRKMSLSAGHAGVYCIVNASIDCSPASAILKNSMIYI